MVSRRPPVRAARHLAPFPHPTHMGPPPHPRRLGRHCPEPQMAPPPCRRHGRRRVCRRRRPFPRRSRALPTRRSAAHALYQSSLITRATPPPPTHTPPPTTLARPPVRSDEARLDRALTWKERLLGGKTAHPPRYWHRLSEGPVSLPPMPTGPLSSLEWWLCDDDAAFDGQSTARANRQRWLLAAAAKVRRAEWSGRVSRARVPRRDP